MDTIIEFTLYAIVEKYGTLGYVELTKLLNIEISNKEDDEIGIEWKRYSKSYMETTGAEFIISGI